ncbi:MAG: hypothetical protein WEB52_16265 [Dehalococcoidia bacterium]
MGSWDFIHNWYMPFVWLTIASIVSVPVAVYLQQDMQMHAGPELGFAYGSSWALRDDFMATIVVYGLNLGAVIWLFNADGSTRWAAFWATIIGLTKIVTPIALSTMADVAVGVDRHYVDWNTLRVVIWFQDAQLFVLGLMAWALFARFVGAEQTGARHAFAEG